MVQSLFVSAVVAASLALAAPAMAAGRAGAAGKPAKPPTVAPNPHTPWPGQSPAANTAVAAPAAATAPAATMGLADLLESGLLQNPATRAAWERARQQAAQWRESLGTYWPRFDAGLDVLGSHTEAETTSNIHRRYHAGRSPYAGLPQDLRALAEGLYALQLPSRDERIHEDSRVTTAEPSLNPYLSLTWLLFDFGAREAAVESFRQTLIASNFAYNRELQRVVHDVQRDYFFWDGSRAALAVQDSLVANAKKSVELVDVRYQAGLTPKTDLLQTQQFLARTEFDRESAALAVAQRHAALLTAAGLFASAEVSVRSGDRYGVPTDFASGIGALVEQGLALRPDLAQRLAAMEAAEAEYRRTRREVWPTVSLFGGLQGSISEYDSRVTRSGSQLPGGSVTEFSRVHDETLDSFIGIGAQLNIFDGFAKYRRIDRARSARDEAAAVVQSGRLDISREVWDSWQAYRSARRQTELGAKLVKASQESYDAVLDAYTTGLKSILDVISATDDLGRAQLSEIEARYRTLTEAVELAYALGNIAVPAVAVPPPPTRPAAPAR